MKIKTDFVTNSSSTSFILAIKEEQLPHLQRKIYEIDGTPEAADEGARIYNIFKSIDQLNVYVNNEPLDWASKPTGPRFINMSKNSYEIYKKGIDDGNVMVALDIDNYASESFEKKWHKYIVDINPT